VVSLASGPVVFMPVHSLALLVHELQTAPLEWRLTNPTSIHCACGGIYAARRTVIWKVRFEGHGGSSYDRVCRIGACLERLTSSARLVPRADGRLNRLARACLWSQAECGSISAGRLIHLPNTFGPVCGGVQNVLHFNKNGFRKDVDWARCQLRRVFIAPSRVKTPLALERCGKTLARDIRLQVTATLST